uniref:Ankyrin repeat domain-containing protein n=1 Tax=Crocodylus porosus TaxID=8502 RepID=A0A7M4FAW1_CROPO
MAASPGDHLASAAARGDCAAVQALLEAGADPDAQNRFGGTPS